MPQTPPARPAVTIVEDDRSLLRALAFSLDAEGFQVSTFADAESLLAAPIAADCLVVDQKLPGMDGLTLLAGLRARNITSPAILITTNPNRKCREKARVVGAEIVEKPLMNAALSLAIQSAIDNVSGAS